MHRLLIAAVLIAAAGPAGAETVYATRAMNTKLDGFTAGLTPVGQIEPNRSTRLTCRTVTGDFRYPDGRVVKESKQRCD